MQLYYLCLSLCPGFTCVGEYLYPYKAWLNLTRFNWGRGHILWSAKNILKKRCCHELFWPLQILFWLVTSFISILAIYFPPVPLSIISEITLLLQSATKSFVNIWGVLRAEWLRGFPQCISSFFFFLLIRCGMPHRAAMSKMSLSLHLLTGRLSGLGGVTMMRARHYERDGEKRRGENETFLCRRMGKWSLL